MKHNLKLRGTERIRALFSLNDFLLKLLEDNFSQKEFKKRLKKMREEHLKRDSLLFTKLSEGHD